jgi:hypothetical protein
MLLFVFLLGMRNLVASEAQTLRRKADETQAQIRERLAELER